MKLKVCLLTFIVILLAITAPGRAPSAAFAQSATPAATVDASAPKVPLTLFLGYINNVQFAPVYVALERGYFADQGLDIKLEPSYNETDGVTRIGVDNLQFGIVSGEQVVLARAKGAPVVYVFGWYQKYPVGVVAPAESGISDAKGLTGKVVGVPAKYGASYIGLQALLSAAGMTESDLKEVREIGFDTAPVFCAKQVEASVVYVANEPLQIEDKCGKVNVICISDTANLAANGIITNEATIKNHPDWVRAINAAFAKGLADTIADPKAAFDISRKYVENLGDDPIQRQVLDRSIELWKADQLGQIDPAVWKLTQDTLLNMKLLDKPIDIEKAYSTDFLPK